MEMLDTMLIIKYCNNNKLPCCAISEVSIFEMLRNKDSKTFLCELNKLKKNFIFSKSVLFVSNDYPRFLSEDNSIENDYLLAKRLIRNVSLHLAKVFNLMCGSITELIIISKIIHLITKSNDEEIKRIEKIFLSFNSIDLVDNQKEEWIKMISESDSKYINNDFFISFINCYINFYNSKVGVDSLKIPNITAINKNGVISNNNIKINAEIIDKYINEVLLFKNNEEISKRLFKIYIKDLLLNSGKLTFNDLADILIFFGAYSNNLILKTEDKKIKRLLLNMDKN